MYASVRSDIRGWRASNGELEESVVSARNGTCKVKPCWTLTRPMMMIAVQKNFMEEVDCWVRLLSKCVFFSRSWPSNTTSSSSYKCIAG
jgi:hypothetical protein